MAKYWKLKVTHSWDMMTEPYRLIDDYTYLIKDESDSSKEELIENVKSRLSSNLSVYNKQKQDFIHITLFCMKYEVILSEVVESDLKKLIVTSELMS